MLAFRFAAPLSFVALLASLSLTGCAFTDLASPTLSGTPAATSIRGSVHGGQQPVLGAHVYMFAVNTTGYGGAGIAPSTGNASVSLLKASATGNADTIGAYVLTGSGGSFSISGDYTCTANTQVYLYVVGGNPGAGTNSAAGFLAAMGNCPAAGNFVGTVPYISVNEVTTVAAAYAMAGFASDALHVSSSGSTLALSGVANAFLNAANLASIGSGAALAVPVGGNGNSPQATVNTLADILASCINSNGPSSYTCNLLFTDAPSSASGGTTPTDTATAVINIAHNPGANVAGLFALATPTSPFLPTLYSAPNDFMLALQYNAIGSSTNGAYTLAIDAQGAVWFTDSDDQAIDKLASNGVPLSPSGGFTAAIAIPGGIAIDTVGNAWIVDSGVNKLIEINAGGTMVGSFGGGGLSAAQTLAIDGNNNIWVANFSTDVSEFNAAGTPLSSSQGFTGGGTMNSTAIEVDNSGLPWIANQSPAPGAVSKFNSSNGTGNGTPLSGSGYVGGGINNPQGMAIDNANAVWVSDYTSNAVTKFDTNGNPLSPSGGFTGGGITRPYGLSVDGAGNVWIANISGSTISELNNSGNALSPSTGFGSLSVFTTPDAIAIDASGDVWVANHNTTVSSASAVTVLVGAAAPRIVPLSMAVKTGSLGLRP